MKNGKLYLITSIYLFVFVSCEKSDLELVRLNPKETFVSSDAPVAYVHENFTFQSPWGYKKKENACRYYPIVVCGLWSEGRRYYQAVAQQYPAFVIDYLKSTEPDGQVLAKWIRSARKAGYRIDFNRIYLTGFSQGGSGSFSLAKGMYAQGLYFAAIMRVSGSSQSDLGNEIAQKTAVWYHVGLADYEIRIKNARETLQNMRNYKCNSGVVETKVFDTIIGFERNTITLTRSRYPMFKLSEYAKLAHTYGPCYADGTEFPWLFSHSLKYR